MLILDEIKGITLIQIIVNPSSDFLSCSAVFKRVFCKSVVAGVIVFVEVITALIVDLVDVDFELRDAFDELPPCCCCC